nr:udp-glycosyltransferase 89b1 [Quercus suber]
MLANFESWEIVFNSFASLGSVYFDHLKREAGHNRVWAVGPVLPLEGDLIGSATRGGASSVPCHELMTWLDACLDNSVVYVCFGSRAGLTNKQLNVLAIALECSGVHFTLCTSVLGDQEQFTNALLLVDQLGVAIIAGEGTENIPDSNELARLLVVSLNKIKPQNVRAKELSDVALSAVKGGSSNKDLDELIKQLANIKKLE